MSCSVEIVGLLCSLSMVMFIYGVNFSRTCLNFVTLRCPMNLLQCLRLSTPHNCLPPIPNPPRNPQVRAAVTAQTRVRVLMTRKRREQTGWPSFRNRYEYWKLAFSYFMEKQWLAAHCLSTATHSSWKMVNVKSSCYWILPF